jgi:hypothetical protein
MQSLLPLFGTSPNWEIGTKSCCTHYPQVRARPPSCLPHFQKNENGGGENGWKLLIIKEGKGNCVSGFNNG